MKEKLRSAATWIFVITTLWVGFVLAISFMEAPLKFSAPSLSLKTGLEIGHIVFHALNKVEMLFALLLAAATYLARPSRRSKLLTFLVISIWIVQTILLYTILDARTLAIIEGSDVPPAPYHLIYVAMEVLKLLLLIGLAFSQIIDFKTHVLENYGDK